MNDLADRLSEVDVTAGIEAAEGRHSSVARRQPRPVKAERPGAIAALRPAHTVALSDVVSPPTVNAATAQPAEATGTGATSERLPGSN